MIRKTIGPMGLMIVAWAMLACVSSGVDVAVEPGLQFDPVRYATYAHAPDAENPLLEAVRIEVDRTLQAEGYQLNNDADLLVAYSIDSESEVRRVNAADPDTDYPVSKTFTQDTIVITFVDARSGEAVWRGSATEDTMIGGALLSESRSQSVSRAARSILAALPKKQF